MRYYGKNRAHLNSDVNRTVYNIRDKLDYDKRHDLSKKIDRMNKSVNWSREVGLRDKLVDRRDVTKPMVKKEPENLSSSRSRLDSITKRRIYNTSFEEALESAMFNLLKMSLAEDDGDISGLRRMNLGLPPNTSIIFSNGVVITDTEVRPNYNGDFRFINENGAIITNDKTVGKIVVYSDGEIDITMKSPEQIAKQKSLSELNMRLFGKKTKVKENKFKLNVRGMF